MLKATFFNTSSNEKKAKAEKTHIHIWYREKKERIEKKRTIDEEEEEEGKKYKPSSYIYCITHGLFYHKVLHGTEHMRYHAKDIQLKVRRE